MKRARSASFVGTCIGTCLFLSMSAFLLHSRVKSLWQWTIWPTKPKIFTNWLFTEEVCRSLEKVMERGKEIILQWIILADTTLPKWSRLASPVIIQIDITNTQLWYKEKPVSPFCSPSPKPITSGLQNCQGHERQGNMEKPTGWRRLRKYNN